VKLGTTRAALVLTLLAGLAACSGESPGVGGTTTASGVSAEPAGASSAFGNPGGAKGAETTFSPFGDPNTAAPGGRKIIANPTAADIFAASPLPEMALGKADAPLTIVQYASMTCPHCRHFHKTTFPQLKKEFIDTGKIRYILREFPIGKQSGQATIALRCAPPEKYFALYGKLMEQQDAWVSQEVRIDPIFAVVKQVGVTRAQFDACLKDDALVASLNAIKERGRTLGIIGTPNYFVGTTLVKKELTIEDIRAAVAGGQIATR
jgi:protein-disulfide isomerase